jgi:hypothetical protein
LDDLTQAENDQVFLDDVLMLRFMLLYVISEEVKRAHGEPAPTAFALEQPADSAQMHA